MTDREYRRWKALRSQGALRFILIKGVLMWGGVMFVVMTFVFNQDVEGARSSSRVLSGLLTYPAGGFFFGGAVWLWSEKRFKQAQQQRAADDLPG